MGSICLGLFIVQFFLYDLSELTSKKSIISIASIFVIGVSCILSGLLIKVDEK